MPDVTGENQAQAKSDLHNAGFQVKVTPQTTTTTPAGRVIQSVARRQQLGASPGLP